MQPPPEDYSTVIPPKGYSTWRTTTLPQHCRPQRRRAGRTTTQTGVENGRLLLPPSETRLLRGTFVALKYPPRPLYQKPLPCSATLLVFS